MITRGGVDGGLLGACCAGDGYGVVGRVGGGAGRSLVGALGGTFLVTSGGWGWEGGGPEVKGDGCLRAIWGGGAIFGARICGGGTGFPPVATWGVGVKDGWAITCALAICSGERCTAWVAIDCPLRKTVAGTAVVATLRFT